MIRSKPSTQDYRNNYDRTFNKTEEIAKIIYDGCRRAGIEELHRCKWTKLNTITQGMYYKIARMLQKKIFKGGQDAKRNNRAKNNNAIEVQSKDTGHESGILRQNRDDA